jgi:hypothetical protein
MSFDFVGFPGARKTTNIGLGYEEEKMRSPCEVVLSGVVP